MGSVVTMKKRDMNIVSQDELYELYKLEQRYLNARAEYQTAIAKTVLRLKQGRQEPGKYHLEKKTKWRRSVSWKGIVIEIRGEKFAAQKLAETAPKAYTRLEFSDPGKNTKL